jgi:hypothetical protein
MSIYRKQEGCDASTLIIKDKLFLHFDKRSLLISVFLDRDVSRPRAIVLLTWLRLILTKRLARLIALVENKVISVDMNLHAWCRRVLCSVRTMGVRLFYKRKFACRRFAERSPLWFWDVRSFGRVDVGAVALFFVLMIVVNGGHDRDVGRLEAHSREALRGTVITARRQVCRKCGHFVLAGEGNTTFGWLDVR